MSRLQAPFGQPGTLSEEFLEKHSGHTSVQFVGNVNKQEIKSKLLKLKANKATGCDNIPPQILKLMHTYCQDQFNLLFLINKSVDINTLPDALKLADVVAVYKK